MFGRQAGYFLLSLLKIAYRSETRPTRKIPICVSSANVMYCSMISPPFLGAWIDRHPFSDALSDSIIH